MRRQPAALRVDAIDLYQIHWPIPDDEIEEGMGSDGRPSARGKVRHIGVSNFNVAQMKRALNHCSNHIAASLATRCCTGRLSKMSCPRGQGAHWRARLSPMASGLLQAL